MAYETPDTKTYSFNDATYGATAVAHQIIGPRGKVGFVREIEVDVTTSLVGTTSVPEIVVGLSSGDATFGRYRLGTTASLGYGTGAHIAGNEAIIGNPPRTLGDFSGHVILDGGPLTSQGISGGTYISVVPSGRIPASPLTITNVISGTAAACRCFIQNGVPPLLAVGQTLQVRNVAGATGANGQQTISAIDTAVPAQWIELSGTTFGGTYTAGGQADIVTFITGKAGVGGTPAGGGHYRVKIEWVGPNNP